MILNLFDWLNDFCCFSVLFSGTCHLHMSLIGVALVTKCVPVNVTVFWKTDRMVTNTEIHFMPVDECHTHALPRNTMHLRIVGQVCFYRRLFCDAVKPQGCISWPVWPLRGINKTAWGAKLILTAGLVHHSSCASLGHLLMAQHCHFCLGVCFGPPTAPHPPPPPTPPAHPL